MRDRSCLPCEGLWSYHVACMAPVYEHRCAHSDTSQLSDINLHLVHTYAPNDGGGLASNQHGPPRDSHQGMPSSYPNGTTPTVPSQSAI